MRPGTVLVSQKTTIRVDQSTKERLREHGEMGMSYDDVVNHVLDRLDQLEAEDSLNNE